MASGFHRSPESSQRLAAHTPSGAPMLQDTGCGNNVTRVLPPCLPKLGFADCLFEGKEASDKHPVLKCCLGFVAVQGGELPLWQRGERNVEEKASISRDIRGLSSPICLVQFAESIFFFAGSRGLQLYILKGLVLYSLCRACTHSPRLKYPFLSWEAGFRFPLRNTHRKRAIDESDKAIFHFPFLSIVRLRNPLSTYSLRGYDFEDPQQIPPCLQDPLAH